MLGTRLPGCSVQMMVSDKQLQPKYHQLLTCVSLKRVSSRIDIVQNICNSFRKINSAAYLQHQGYSSTLNHPRTKVTVLWVTYTIVQVEHTKSLDVLTLKVAKAGLCQVTLPSAALIGHNSPKHDSTFKCLGSWFMTSSHYSSCSTHLWAQ